MPTINQRRGRGYRILAGLAGLLVFVILATLVTHDWDDEDKPKTEKANSKPIGTDGLKPETVTVTGEKVPTEIKAVPAKPFSALKMARSLTEPMEIGPSGKLDAPVTVRFKLSRAPKNADAVVIATRQAHGSTEDYLAPASVTGRHVSVQVSHFSLFQVLEVNMALVQPTLKKVVDQTRTNPDATAPKCDAAQEKAARGENYQIASSGKRTLAWCFEKTGKNRVLKVTNQMYYAVRLRYDGMRVINSGIITPELTQLSKLANSKRATTVLPGDSIEFMVNQLAHGKKASVATSVDGSVQGLRKLDLLVQSAIMLGSKFGAVVKIKPATKLFYEIVDELMRKPNCYAAVFTNDTLDMLANCLDWKVIGRKLGDNISKVLSLTAVLDVFTGYLRSETQVIFDSDSSRYQIAIQRGKVLRFHDLTIPLQPNWNKGEIIKDKNVSGITSGEPCTSSDCPGFMILDEATGIQGAGPAYPYDPQNPWLPGNSQDGCPMDRKEYPFAYHWSGVSGEGSPPVRSTAKIGNRTVAYTEWTVQCATPGDGDSITTSYIQKVWYDPISKIFVVDEWDTPGLKQALANARWS